MASRTYSSTAHILSITLFLNLGSLGVKIGTFQASVYYPASRLILVQVKLLDKVAINYSFVYFCYNSWLDHFQVITSSRDRKNGLK